jgi:hypothetical protein
MCSADAFVVEPVTRNIIWVGSAYFVRHIHSGSFPISKNNDGGTGQFLSIQAGSKGDMLDVAIMSFGVYPHDGIQNSISQTLRFIELLRARATIT